MFYPVADAKHQNCWASKRAYAVRWLLALSICLFASLCVHSALAAERLFAEMQKTNFAAVPIGIEWQHPILLLSLALVIALTGLGCLTLIRNNRMSIIAGLVSAMLLLTHWLVISHTTLFSMMESLK